MDFSQYGDVPSNIQDAIMQASNSTGVSPDLLARVAKQESAFNPNAVSNAGATGLFQTMPDTASELGIEDMTNPYQSAMGGAKYIAQNLQKYGGDLTKALAAYNAGPGNVDSWLANGWDGSPDSIPIEETRNYVKAISGGNNIPVAYTQQGANTPVNLSAQFQLDDPNETIDFGQIMGILNAPKRNVSAAGDDALRSALSRQAHHMARGRLASPFYEQIDKQLMQSAVAKAQEEAKLNNQSTQLTGAGQLAQMIANSKNSSNAGAIAALGQLIGVKLDPMANRYMSQNDMAKMATGFARQDRQIAQEMAFKTQEAEKQRAFQREMEENRQAQALALAQAKASSKGNGAGSSSGSSSSLITSDKYVDKLASDFNDLLAENAEKEEFSQDDVDNTSRRYNDLVLQLSSAQATPYAMEVLKRIGNDYAYQMNHMQESASGNGLNYGVRDEIVQRLKELEDRAKQQKG